MFASDEVLVPVIVLLVAWALYSTEELAQIMEEPFGDETAGGAVKGGVPPKTGAPWGGKLAPRGGKTEGQTCRCHRESVESLVSFFEVNVSHVGGF